MSRSIEKGTGLLILTLAAFAIIGAGLFFDGEVLPPASDTQAIIDSVATQSALSQRAASKVEPTQPSEVAQQLKRAIDAANQSETESAARLEEKITASKALIETTNRLLVEKGTASADLSNSEKSQQFNQKINDLKARLAELKPSH